MSNQFGSRKKKMKEVLAAPSFMEAVKTWQIELAALLDDHHYPIPSMGKRLSGGVTNVDYHAEAGIITCRVYDSAVTIEILDSPYDPELYLNGHCTCGVSDDEDLCEHTYAATAYLQRQFRQSLSPLVKSIRP